VLEVCGDEMSWSEDYGAAKLFLHDSTQFFIFREMKLKFTKMEKPPSRDGKMQQAETPFVQLLEAVRLVVG